MRIVVDTNVWVSGLLSPHGPSARIVRGCLGREWVLCADIRILSEYREVLLRPKFNFDAVHVAEILDHLSHICERVTARPIKKRLHDRDDEPFLEVAVSASVRYLVTGNTRHFPSALSGVTVVTPRQFINAAR